MKRTCPAILPVLILGLSFCLSEFVEAAETQATPIPAGAAVPEWPKPIAPARSPKADSVRSKDIEVIPCPTGPGAFQVRVNREGMALGQSGPLIG